MVIIQDFKLPNLTLVTLLLQKQKKKKCSIRYHSLHLILTSLLNIPKLAASSTSPETEEIYFDFRKQRFIYSNEKNSFCKLPYPSKETIGYYLKHTGYGTEAKAVAASDKWGRNV